MTLPRSRLTRIPSWVPTSDICDRSLISIRVPSGDAFMCVVLDQQCTCRRKTARDVVGNQSAVILAASNLLYGRTHGAFRRQVVSDARPYASGPVFHIRPLRFETPHGIDCGV